MAQRQRRAYLQLLDAAKAAAETAIDAFNRVRHPHRYQTTLLLLTNAWELIAKSVLLQEKEAITRGHRGETISAEVAVHRLALKAIITPKQAETLQQVISLRNVACHHVLPAVPPEVMQHLLFYSCKFFREVIRKQFPHHLKSLDENYLSLSFSELTTYADKIQRAVSKIKKNEGSRRLVWLLERGIQFDGNSYITEAQFAQQFKGRKRILPHLKLSEFLKDADMVRIVPVEAPRNFTADISLRKGSAANASLPVIVKKTEIEVDYPLLTKELGLKLGKSQQWAARAVKVLDMKGNPKFHQPVRAGQKSIIHRYSLAAESALREKLAAEPTFDPYDAA